MEYQRLGQSELRVSRLGVGTVQFGMDYGFTKAKTQAEVDAILRSAHEHGINFLDTARDYGSSEEKIGSFLERNSNIRFTVATKLAVLKSVTGLTIDHFDHWINRSIEQSRAALRQDSLDVLMLHHVHPEIVGNPAFWETLQKYNRKGLFKLFGLSLYEPDQIIPLLDHYGPIHAVQIPFNLFDQRFARLHDTFEQKGIGVIGRSVFLKGVITAASSSLPEELRELIPWKEKADHAAHKQGLSVDQLALLSALTSPLLDTAIIGVDTPQEIARNAKIFEKACDYASLQAEISQFAGIDNGLIDPRKWKNL